MSSIRARRRLRRLGIVAAVIGGTAAAAGPARAAVAQPSCTSRPTSQAFASWGDTNQYALVPGGDFSNSDAAAGWTLGGGAGVTTANIPFDLTGTGANAALSLPAGATVQSPFICVDPSDPTYRFVGVAPGLLSNIAVSAVFQTAFGQQVTLPAVTVPLRSNWAPSAPLYTAAQVASTLSGGTAQMALRFTALGAPAAIDDVFVDPRMGWG